MRKISLFCVLCLAWIPSRAAIPESLTVRAVAWDYSWKPATEEEWKTRVVAEVSAAVKAGADAVVFPEQFSNGRPLEGILDAVKDAAGPDRFVVLGNAPHRGPGEEFAVSRAYILSGGAWQIMDKLDPTPAERSGKPPVKAGVRLPLFRFRGGVLAVLPASSIAKPEIAVSLKKRAVHLVLVTVPVENEISGARVARCASARAVELGAAVVTATPSTTAPALYLPAQEGFELKPGTKGGRDIRLPWKRLLELRNPDASTETRPYLDATLSYQVEI